MFIDLPLIADLVDIQQRRQLRIDENLRRQNQKRREYHFQVGQQVLIKTVDPNKLQPRAHGPYPIVQTYTNGTMDIARAPHVTERINIRRVIPFRNYRCFVFFIDENYQLCGAPHQTTNDILVSFCP